MDKAIAETIASIFPFWAKLSPKAKIDLLDRGQFVSLSVGEFICMEGDICHHLPLLISGSARVYKIGANAREISLYHLDRGDSCIMTASCIISQKVFPAFAIAETELEALVIPANTLREWVRNDHIWQEYIFGLLAQRLAKVIEIVEEVAFGRLDCRIAAYLIDRRDNETQAIAVTHEAIAQELGSSREVVSRILKNWEKQGLLSLSRGKIEQINWLEFKDIAEL
ncbi:MAG: Crp/Fnr family transcriptional regulator [Cyanobacteria bacterium P01_A01_bin.40]